MAVPGGISFQEAEQVVRWKTDWIRKHLERVRLIEQQQPPPPPTEEEIERLFQHTIELARKHGFRINRITVKRMTSRWGSCSPGNNISLNVRILNLPPELRDYVILHELVHTVHKNHGASFWSALSAVCQVEDARQLQRKVRQSGISLYSSANR